LIGSRNHSTSHVLFRPLSLRKFALAIVLIPALLPVTAALGPPADFLPLPISQRRSVDVPLPHLLRQCVELPLESIRITRQLLVEARADNLIVGKFEKQLGARPGLDALDQLGILRLKGIPHDAMVSCRAVFADPGELQLSGCFLIVVEVRTGSPGLQSLVAELVGPVWQVDLLVRVLGRVQRALLVEPIIDAAAGELNLAVPCAHFE